MAVVSSELFLYGVTLHHTVFGISSRVIDFLRMRARARGLLGRRGAVCGIDEYPRHIHEVAWDIGSVCRLASVHGDVYCRSTKKPRKKLFVLETCSETNAEFCNKHFLCEKTNMPFPVFSRYGIIRSFIQR